MTSPTQPKTRTRIKKGDDIPTIKDKIYKKINSPSDYLRGTDKKLHNLCIELINYGEKIKLDE